MRALLILTVFCVLHNTSSQGTQQDYCNLYIEHTLCVHPGFGPACGTGYIEVKPDASQQAVILKWHNNIRQKTANGQETQAIDSLPTASNMRKLVWDDELAAIAQGLANTCVFNHDCSQCRDVLNGRFSYCGQNLAMLWSSGNPVTIDFVAVIDGWYSGEVKNFASQYVPSFQESSTGVIGHYTQVIWAETNSVGCGGIIFDDGVRRVSLVACNYGPGGNFIGAPVYLTGTPCSACPQGTACSEGSLCEVSRTTLRNFNV